MSNCFEQQRGGQGIQVQYHTITLLASNRFYLFGQSSRLMHLYEWFCISARMTKPMNTVCVYISNEEAKRTPSWIVDLLGLQESENVK